MRSPFQEELFDEITSTQPFEEDLDFTEYHDDKGTNDPGATSTWIAPATLGILLLLITLAVLLYLKYLCNRREEVISSIERDSEVEDTSSIHNANPIPNTKDSRKQFGIAETPDRSLSATTSALFQKSTTANGQIKKEENAHLISQPVMEKRSSESSRTWY